MLEVQRSQMSDGGVYQCRSTSDRSVATRRVHVLAGRLNHTAVILYIFIIIIIIIIIIICRHYRPLSV